MPGLERRNRRHGLIVAGTRRGMNHDPRAMPPMKLQSRTATEMEEAPTTS